MQTFLHGYGLQRTQLSGEVEVEHLRNGLGVVAGLRFAVGSSLEVLPHNYINLHAVNCNTQSEQYPVLFGNRKQVYYHV
jgi:hypothetical protein